MITGIVTVGIIFGGITIGAVYFSKKKEQLKLSKENIPPRLGILADVPVDSMLNRLDAALDEGYVSHVKQRFLQENPKVTEDEFEWRLFELKRYFLMTNILKQAPMFSEEVDEIWHQMILFTKKYQVFSEEFLGKMIHHTPNINPKPEPQERAFFDWVFSQLFTVTEFSWKTWGSFFRYPLDSAILKDFNTNSKEWLMEKYFKVTEENKEIIKYLVIQMKQQLLEAEKMDKKGSFKKQETFGEMTQLSLVMVFCSYYYFDDYWTHAKVYAAANASKYTSGCSTAVFCGFASNDNSDNGGHGDGGHGGSHCSSCSGGGSSCSSCGGGCGSS